MDPKASNTDDYLDALPPDQGAALQKLRKQILREAPGCEECFGYGLPGFKLHGHTLFYIGAAKKHCALYGMMPKGSDEDLKDFKRSKGAVRFTPKMPIPAAVVKAIVKAKVKDLELRYAVEIAKSQKTRG